MGQASTKLGVPAAISGPLIISSTEPRLIFNETDAAVNAKRWDVDVNNASLVIRTLTDAGAAGTNFITMNRNGIAPAAASSLIIGGVASFGAEMVFNNAQIVFTSNDEVDFFAEIVSFNASSAFGTGALITMLSDKSVQMYAGQGGTASLLDLQNNAGHIDATATGISGAFAALRAVTGFALPGTTTPATFAANANDFALPGNVSTVRLSSSGAFNLTGMAGGASGRIVILINVGANAIPITNDDAGSAAANRFLNASAGTKTLQSNGAAIVQYDGTSTRWRILTIVA